MLLLVASPPALAQAVRTGRGPVPPPPFFPARALWQVALGAPALPPAIHDGTQLYVTLRTGTVTAWELDGGVARWTARLDAQGPLATDGSRVFVPVEGALEALAPADGTVLWRRPLPEGRVVGLAVTPELLLAVLDTGAVHALRADTGEPRWERSIDGLGQAAPLIAGQATFLARSNGEVLALRIADGRPLWSASVDGQVTGFAARDGRLYFGTTAKAFYSVEADTGRIAWRWRVGAVVKGAPFVDDRHVYFVALDNQIRALDRLNGAQRWRKPLAARPLGSPVPAGTGLATAVLAPELAGVSARDGVSQGRHPLDRELAAPPLVVDRPFTRGGEILVVLLSDGLVVALQRRVEPPFVPLSALPGLPVPLTPPPGSPGDRPLP